MLGVMSACAPPKLTGTLVYARGGESDQLDPIHVDTGESVKVIINVFDTLVTYADDSTELVPCLAESWDTSDDGLIWTFHLRDGVSFHDDTALDSEAVVVSIERLIVPDHPLVFDSVIPYAPDFSVIESVRAVDRLTVEFHLREPSAVFLANLAMFCASIVSPTALESQGRGFSTAPVGTGPFRMEHWVRDQQLVLKAFDAHWRGRPQLDRLVFVPVRESAVRGQQLQRGEAHFADDLPPAELDKLAAHPEIEVQEVPGMNVGYLAMNADRPPLDDRRVRQAVWHMIDKQRLIDVAYAGQAAPAINPLPRTMPAWHDGLVDRAFDVEEAQGLFREAQQDLGFSAPLELELFVMATPRPYMQQPQETAAFLKESLRPLGIELRIVTSETTLHFKRLSGGEHQLALAGWSTDNADPDNFLYALLDPDNINDHGGNNVCRYRNQTVHELLIEAKRTIDADKRIELYREAQELIFADAPMVPLVHTKVRVAHRKELRGYQLHPTGLTWMRAAHIEDGQP